MGTQKWPWGLVFWLTDLQFGPTKIFWGPRKILKCLPTPNICWRNADLQQLLFITDNLFCSTSWFNILLNPDQLFSIDNFAESDKAKTSLKNLFSSLWYHPDVQLPCDNECERCYVIRGLKESTLSVPYQVCKGIFSCVSTERWWSTVYAINRAQEIFASKGKPCNKKKTGKKGDIVSFRRPPLLNG